MILLTTGTQLSFDRLVRAVDAIAPTLDTPVYAQTGQGSYTPQHMKWSAVVPPVEFERLIAQATLLISHAGIGSVLSAQRQRKPIILYPRRSAFREHRNDHQLATVQALEGREGIYIAHDDDALKHLLDRRHELIPSVPSEEQREQLRHRLVRFIAG